VIFSGVTAFKIEVGTVAVALTNGAADTLTRSLALELAPIRVNAISPGVIDTGAWDALGEDGKARLFEELGASNPARRIGTAEDVASAAIFAMTNTFLTGVTIPVDGGQRIT
jgi:NAD(P)-dependent dehydrogenase (short-subunit alcohol dehydrogenase family)